MAYINNIKCITKTIKIRDLRTVIIITILEYLGNVFGLY